MEILIADDEKNITDAIEYALRREGLSLSSCQSGIIKYISRLHSFFQKQIDNTLKVA